MNHDPWADVRVGESFARLRAIGGELGRDARHFDDVDREILLMFQYFGNEDLGGSRRIR